MAAPKGNQFWKLRNKHGRDKLFKTADLLWEAACEYFQWCDENPLLQKDFKGKDAEVVYYEHKRAYTLTGLCLYLDCNTKYFYDFEDSIRGKEDKLSKDFSEIISRMREIIYTQKFEGAASGLFNANIIARDLGLTDKKEVKKETKYEGKDIDKVIEKFKKDLED